MKTWRLATKHKKSFHETEAWSKGKLELIHDVIWQSGSFTIESDTYDGVIGLKEVNDLHIIDHWFYLGTVRTETEIASLLDSA